MSEKFIKTNKISYSPRNGTTPYNNRNYLDASSTKEYLSKLKERHQQYIIDKKNINEKENPFDCLRKALKSNFNYTDNYQIWDN